MLVYNQLNDCNLNYFVNNWNAAILLVYCIQCMYVCVYAFVRLCTICILFMYFSIALMLSWLHQEPIQFWADNDDYDDNDYGYDDDDDNNHHDDDDDDDFDDDLQWFMSCPMQ